MNQISQTPILVIGSTGKTGRRIVRQLRESGRVVREGSRGSDPVWDWAEPATWPEALRGVQAAYISYFPDLAVPGAPAAIQTLTEYAIQAGVGRLVLLSGRGEVNAQRCETIVRECGIPFTLIRASWFAQNFNEGHFLGPVLAGHVAMPADDVREPFVDVDDIADVAVAALTDSSDRHSGQLYELTGPRLMTFGEAVARISQAAGRNVEYTPISLAQMHAAMTENAGPQMADMFTDLCREVLDGRNASLGDGVRKALGREPRDFADFCRRTAESGVWNVSA